MAATTVVRTGPAAMFPSGGLTALMLPSLIRLSVTPRSEAVRGPVGAPGADRTPGGVAARRRGLRRLARSCGGRDPAGAAVGAGGGQQGHGGKGGEHHAGGAAALLQPGIELQLHRVVASWRAGLECGVESRVGTG